MTTTQTALDAATRTATAFRTWDALTSAILRDGYLPTLAGYDPATRAAEQVLRQALTAAGLRYWSGGR